MGIPLCMGKGVVMSGKGNTYMALVMFSHLTAGEKFLEK